MKYLTLVCTHLKWVFDFLLCYPFYKLHDDHPHQLPKIGSGEEELCRIHYEEDVDCAVCLCKIGELGEEIRVLRCDHMFHKDCLDRWVGLKNTTCPLCRESIGPKRAITQLGAEVLLFRVFSTRADEERDTWWLRWVTLLSFAYQFSVACHLVYQISIFSDPLQQHPRSAPCCGWIKANTDGAARGSPRTSHSSGIFCDKKVVSFTQS